jgi:hypothetical protein
VLSYDRIVTSQPWLLATAISQFYFGDDSTIGNVFLVYTRYQLVVQFSILWVNLTVPCTVPQRWEENVELNLTKSSRCEVRYGTVPHFAPRGERCRCVPHRVTATVKIFATYRTAIPPPRNFLPKWSPLASSSRVVNFLHNLSALKHVWKNERRQKKPFFCFIPFQSRKKVPKSEKA